MTNRPLLSLVLAVLLAPVARARKPSPLPEFPLTTSDGRIVQSSQIRLPNHWLLIYVHQNSGHSALVLNSLAGEQPSALGQKIVIIVGGARAADLPDMSKKYPHMATVSWYADPKREAMKALGLRASPVVLGVRHDTVQWSLVGTLPDREQMKSILRTWKNKDK